MVNIDNYKKKISLVIFSFLTLMVMSGCSATGPKFSKFEKPKEGNAALYIYRDSSFFGGGVTPFIHKKDLSANKDELIGEIKRSGYLRTELRKGTHEIWATTEVRNGININALENDIYCLEHYITPGFFVGHPQFKRIDFQKCEEEIKKTHLSLE